MSREPEIGPALDVLGSRCRVDEPIGPLTTYRVGGAAAIFVDVEDEDDLRLLARAVRASGLPVVLVGNGSNLLVAEAGFDGIAAKLGGGFCGVEIADDRVRAGGAALLPVVARRTAAAGLRGFEWAVGVPGSIGGAVRMNAGGHGSDMAASLERVRVFDLRTGDDDVVPASDLELAYRHSAIRPSQVVVWADLGLRPGDVSQAEREVAEVVRWRREHQPGGANAGSVFTNPPGDAAGRLIEAVGGRGLRMGSAAVSVKHANFIQADEGGSADDVMALMQELRRRVRHRFGVELEVETRVVGYPESNPGLEVES